MSSVAAESWYSLDQASIERGIIAASEAMRDAVMLADRYAREEFPVLIVGETGTGKELIAHRVYASSGRTGPLVPVNCGDLRPEQAANLLFGHRRGAFTDAREDTCGFVRRSHRGTLFLDELSSLPIESQASLLRVLETGEVTPVGGDTPIRVDLRVVAVAQPSMLAAIESGRFRQDLYERLAVGLIRLPPLRNRLSDVAPLAAAFAHAKGKQLASEAVARLESHSWPGNVRELKAVLLRAVALGNSVLIGEPDIARAMQLGSPPQESRGEDAERRELELLCIKAFGDWRQLAALMQVSKSTVYRRLGKHGLLLKRSRDSRLVSRLSRE